MSATAHQHYRPVVLVVLDGWGRAASGPACNAIELAATPNLDRWELACPHALLGAAGADVGLKDGQMGDSNVGHLNLGAGRIVYQDVVRIDRAIAQDGLAANPVIADLMGGVAARGGTLHLMGLVSDGGVHSHLDHVRALLAAAAGHRVGKVRVHAFLDGRDVPPRSAARYLAALSADLLALAPGGGSVTAAAPVSPGWAIGSLCGRYYAMDRDSHWERVQQAYLTITGHGQQWAGDWMDALAAAYEAGESDEFVRPVGLPGLAPMADGDAVLFFNFRADRARELTRAFAEPDAQFAAFERPSPRPAIHLATLTSYDAASGVPAAFAPQDLANTLGQVVSAGGLRQLRLAETEKYAHVTFFFSGGREEPFAGEERILVPSPRVATYDLMPQMAAAGVTSAAVSAIRAGRFDLMVVNYANGDMVGHTGDLRAAITAVEAVDAGLGELVPAALDQGGAVLIVSDHGNAETMYDAAEDCPHTAHTSNPVPVVLVARGLPPGTALRDGILADVAPTLLDLLDLPVPAEMTGRSLLLPPGLPAGAVTNLIRRDL